MSDASGGKSGILSSLLTADTIKVLLAPIISAKKDIDAIRDSYQLPEHITHLILLIGAIGVGSALPFAYADYGSWIGGTLQSLLNVTGATNSFLTWLSSTWVCSTATSWVSNKVIQVVHKIGWGDWDYRLTNGECHDLVEKFREAGVEIDTTELTYIYKTLLERLNKSSDSIGVTPDVCQKLLHKLFLADPDAIDGFDHQQAILAEQLNRLKARSAAVKTLKQQPLECRVSTETKEKEHDASSASDVIVDLSARPVDRSQLSPHPLVEVEGAPSLVVGTESSSIALPLHSDATLASPRLVSVRDDVASVELGQLPVVSTPQPVLTPYRNTHDAYLSRTKKRAAKMPVIQRQQTFSRREIEIAHQMAELQKVMGQAMSAELSGAERTEREELISRAAALRGQIIASKKTREAPSVILERHHRTLLSMDNEQLRRTIAEDEAILKQATEITVVVAPTTVAKPL